MRNRSTAPKAPGLSSDAPERAEALNASPAPVAGVPGPGRWLVSRYAPTALFALKMSQATSSVGKTLLVPTMYAIKMAVVDAGFRMGLPDAECAALLQWLAPVDVRVAPPERAVVTHTFVKIRQEPKTPDRLHPYASSIAYREVVHFAGNWEWAFDLATCDPALAAMLPELLAHVCSIGQRGCFVQLLGLERRRTVGVGFTQPHPESGFLKPKRWHISVLDDFGPEASLEVLSTYSAQLPKRDRHRRFIRSIVPLGVVSTGPGFTEYARE